MRAVVFLTLPAFLWAAPPDRIPEAAALQRQILPVDAALGNAKLIEFRHRLLKAAERHDLAHLVTVADSKIRGCGWQGIDGFQQLFVPPRGSDYDPWLAFRTSLQLGGVMESPTYFRSNYLIWKFPKGLDMTAYSVVTKRNVAVYRKPNLTSSVIAHLQYNLVVPLDNDGLKWQRIRFGGGETGYILSSDLKSPSAELTIGLREGPRGWRISSMAGYCD